MAALMPHTSPWSSALRGSSDGVKARHAKARAPHAPGSVYRNRRRPAARGAGASSSAPAGSPFGPASPGALPVRARASLPWVVITHLIAWQLDKQGNDDTQAVDRPMDQHGSE